MRRFPKRPDLPDATQRKLAAETNAITASADHKAEAARRYSNARQTRWFAPVVTALEKLSGPGQRCMFCSGSEASDVEHYRPKAVFPELAMTWENYLWSCTPCNRGKLNRFPPDTQPGGQLINPVEEDAWQHFFIDEFGLLTPRFDPSTNTFDERAVSTRDLLDLNRDAVQESRQIRLTDLKSQVAETIQLIKLNQLTKAAARKKIDNWASQPFQPDVANYFLLGPGRSEKPFSDLLALV